MFKKYIIFISLFNSGCHRLDRDVGSQTKVDDANLCSGPIEKLNVDCLIEIFKYLPDNEVIRNVRFLNQKNPALKAALLSVADKEVPEWRKIQIRKNIERNLQKELQSNQAQTPDEQRLLVSGRVDEEVIRNYVEFVKLMSNESTREKSPAGFQVPKWEHLAVFAQEKGSFSTLGGTSASSLSLIGGHQFVYQRLDRKIVGIDMTNGSETFTYDVENARVTNFTSLNDNMFLSVQSGMVFLWPTKPSVTTSNQKPLMIFKRRALRNAEADWPRLIVMSPDSFVVVSNTAADAFTTKSAEPVASTSGEVFKYRLKKINEDEVFIEPIGAIESWAPEFWNIKTNRMIRNQPIAFTERSSYSFEVVAKNKIIFTKKNPSSNNIHQVFLYKRDLNSTAILDSTKEYWKILANNAIALSGKIYEFNKSDRAIMTDIKNLPMFQIGSDFYISRFSQRCMCADCNGSVEPIYSWKKRLQQTGRAKFLGTGNRNYSLWKTTDKGELILIADNSILIINLWTIVANQLKTNGDGF